MLPRTHAIYLIGTVLTSGLPWDEAAAAHFRSTGRAAGNGSLMRATTTAVHFAGGRARALRGRPRTRLASRPGHRVHTDTVAAVTGGLAGAVHGMDAIPARWLEPLHVPLPGADPARVLRADDLRSLAERL